MLFIDARCLNEPRPTGVTEVARQFITALKNKFPNAPLLTTEQSFSNTIANLRLALRLTTLEKMFGQNHAQKNNRTDAVIFLPNINFAHHLPTTQCIQLVHDLSFLHTPRWYPLRARLWHIAAAAAHQLQTATHLIAVSEWTRQDLITHLNIPPERVAVINPYTPTSTIPTVPRLPFTAAPFFLFIGTQEKRKNTMAIIEAFNLIKNTNGLADYQLVLAGKPGFGYHHPTKNNPPGPSRVHFLPYVTNAEKWWLLRAARAFVFPSFFEGFGLPPLEAASVGCPTIVSDCTALPETMRDAALLVSPYDVKQLAIAMQAMAIDDALHAQLKIRGPQRAAWYSKERQNTAINDLFSKLIPESDF